DVAVVLGEHPQDVLPLDLLERGRVRFRGRGCGDTGAAGEHGGYVFGPGWLGQEIARAELQGFGRRRDGSVVRERNDLGARAARQKLRDEAQAETARVSQGDDRDV